MKSTVKVKVFVVFAGWESLATTVITVVPYWCNLGWIESSRFVPEPVKARLELLIRLVFEDVAVVVTVNTATALSVTPISRSVEESSVTVGLVGTVNTGPAAWAAAPPKISNTRTVIRRNNLLAFKRQSAPA